ncbi:MAG: hypothetical protein R6V03_04660 [Kiritimatiellia bacterium]
MKQTNNRQPTIRAIAPRKANNNIEFTAYSDESYSQAERFRSIGVFSFPSFQQKTIDKEITALLRDSSVAEFKWQNLKDAKHGFCAIKLIDFVLHEIYEYNLRIDVMVWDTHDSRHAVPARDDTANFERMLFHLLRNSMKRREKLAAWRIRPDERMDIDWSTVAHCLRAVGRQQDFVESPLLGDFFTDPHYDVCEFREILSHEHPCCQVADLFAGLSVFSRTHFCKFAIWKDNRTPNLGLFDDHRLVLSKREFSFPTVRPL